MKISLVSFQIKPMKITGSIHLLVQINKASFILGIMLICVTDLHWSRGEDRKQEKQKLKSWLLPQELTMFQSKKKYYSDELKLRVIGSLVFSTFKYKKIKAILLWHLQEHYSFVLGLKIHRIANGLFTRTLLPFWKHLLLNQSVSFKTKFAYIFIWRSLK